MLNAKLNHNQKKLVCDYLPIVRKIARHYHHSLGGNVSFEDLCQEGSIGLIDAAMKFVTRMKCSFSTYAMIRIRGAIMDYIRSNDRLSRYTRKAVNRVKKAFNELCQQNGSNPTTGQVASHLKIPERTVSSLMQISRRSVPVSLENCYQLKHYNSGFGNYNVIIRTLEIRDVIRKGLKILNRTEKKVLALYYVYQLREREIKDILNVSNTRVNQIRKSAIAKLRKTIRPIVNEGSGIFRNDDGSRQDKCKALMARGLISNNVKKSLPDKYLSFNQSKNLRIVPAFSFMDNVVKMRD